MAISRSARETLSALPDAKTSLGKQRAWLRMTLMEKRLGMCMSAMAADIDATEYAPAVARAYLSLWVGNLTRVAWGLKAVHRLPCGPARSLTCNDARHSFVSPGVGSFMSRRP